MSQRDGYSFYGQNMRPNPNPNHYQYKNNNNKNYQYPNNNYYPNLQNKNLGQNPNINRDRNNNNYKNFNNYRPPISNKKYSDLEIRTIFSNANNSGLPAKDLQLQSELNIITNQYMSIFNNINKLRVNPSRGNSDYSYQLNKIKEEIEKVNNFNGNEYSNFISQLFEVSNDGNVLNLNYDSFKKNNNEVERQIKQVINNFKYDIVLYKNKGTTTPQIYQKLNDYINLKKNPKKNDSNNYKNNYKDSNNYNIDKNYKNNYNSSNNYNNSNNYNSDKYNNNKNSFYNKNSNIIKESDTYETNDDDNDFNLFKADSENEIKKKYDDPNYISDYNNNYNNLIDEDNKKNSGPINVKFVVDGNEIFHEVKSDESGEVLQLLAMQEIDDPHIFTQDGRELSYDLLLKSKVGDIFENCEPTLNIY